MKVRVMKYKVGDKVRVRADLQQGWKYSMEHGSTNSFVSEMMPFRGKTVTIKAISGGEYIIEELERYHWTDEMFEPVNNQKIVITSDGVETLARLYDGNKVVKSASAKCNPEDEFDFKFGANLAFERLMSEEKLKVEEKPVEKPKYEVGQYYQHNGQSGKGIFIVTKIEGKTVYYEIVEGMKKDTPGKDFDLGSCFDRDTTPVTWNVVDRPVKKGDYVRLVDTEYTFNKVGDILKIHDEWGTGVHVLAKDHPRDTGMGECFKWCYLPKDFEVVELPSEKKSEPETETKTETKPTFKEGDRVRHSEFGDGTVICMAFDGDYGVEFDEKKGWCHNCNYFNLKWGKKGTKKTSSWCRPETLTLITEKPEKPEKPKKDKKQKYNGKVVCVESKHKFWTVGKVYEFKDGIITDDDGDRRGVMCHFGCFEDWDEFCNAGRGMKFIEVVE
jgi:hypothetical protein